jgi:hypothetical protein
MWQSLDMRKLSVPIAAVAALAVALPASAASGSHTATDHIAGLRFTLTGKRLALRITTQNQGKKVAAGPQVKGKKVSLDCGTKAASGKPNSKLVARGGGKWAKGANAATFRLSRDLGGNAAWCLLQSGGRIVAYVDFSLGRNPTER